MQTRIDLREMLGLKKKGLVISREEVVDGDNLILFKYHNKVFYKNLWHVSDALREARGIVFNKDTGEIVQRPFHKIFNVGENGQETPEGCERQMKVNGFMCAATLRNGKPFVTTTGSMDSSYQQLAKQYVENINWIFMNYNMTFLFEVCDPSDPHIVEEDQGIYLLSIRDKYDGVYYKQSDVDVCAAVIGAKRPSKKLSNDKEGWVYYDTNGVPIAKTKTPHYLSKKAMMRLGKKQVDLMYNHPEQFKQRLDEEFYDVYNYLTDNYSQDGYASLNEQERREIIEEWFYGE